MDFYQSAGIGRGCAFHFNFFQIGEGNHISDIIDHESLAVFSDLQIADEGRQLVDLYIYADDTFYFAIYSVGWTSDGDPRFLGGEKNVRIRPDDPFLFLGLYIPGAFAGIIDVIINNVAIDNRQRVVGNERPSIEERARRRVEHAQSPPPGLQAAVISARARRVKYYMY